jgi:hypothetical protein
MTELSTRKPIVFTVLGLAALATMALSGCGSAAHPAAAAGAAGTQSPAAIATTCQQVSAVLSDGPDPDADPVGYAEAQVDPLRLVTTHDSALQAAIVKLADAYQEFFTSNGSSTAKEAVAVASSKINSICPGAAS